FGIIGVSLDNDENVWNKAIADDKLTWIQVSDLQYWNSEAAKLYYVKFIPQNIFVDQEGKIVQRKVDKDKIEDLLNEFLGL
ncbi:MAG: thioredoxin-like domain-containing protein, partial [Bacteroidales bacterium]|nr:thioredoxin-like domain-containing protein [Bacteroidales bacterium]